MKFQAFLFSPYDDLLIAYLNWIGFDSFQEEEGNLVGYVEENTLSGDDMTEISKYCMDHKIQWKEIEVEDKNWNEIWETSFEPVLVEDFCLIKASFHKIEDNVPFVITIDPKMAFGTGHHQTTYMMIQAMASMNFAGKKVLDYGSGTGVLAILAEKMGATHVDALDIEEDAVENIQENISQNSCRNIHPILGTIEEIKDEYDIILANINRNILLETARDVLSRLKPKGELLLSGILSGDLETVIAKYENLGFIKKKVLQKSNWQAVYLFLDE